MPHSEHQSAYFTGILSMFDLASTEAPRLFGGGHIHSTYYLESQGAGYLLQRVNTKVFPDTVCLERNIRAVSRHLQASDDIWLGAGQRSLQFVPSDTGHLIRQYQGSHWRVCRYIANSVSRIKPGNPTEARTAATAFGRFNRSLLDLDPSALCETIPGFHDTAARVRVFDAALVTSDRVSHAGSAIEFLEARRDALYEIAKCHSDGTLVRRVCHNDAKMDNLLLAKDSGDPLCVIDWDTIMPGSPLYDLGDLLRSAGATEDEEETDLSLIAVDEDSADAVVAGFLEALSDELTPVEVELAPKAGWHITMEQGVRFLSDFLVGDTYYPVARDRHNLDRALNQFTLAKSMEEWLGWRPAK